LYLVFKAAQQDAQAAFDEKVTVLTTSGDVDSKARSWIKKFLTFDQEVKRELPPAASRQARDKVASKAAKFVTCSLEAFLVSDATEPSGCHVYYKAQRRQTRRDHTWQDFAQETST